MHVECRRRAFPSGEKVTYTGAEVVCSNCIAAGPQRQTARTATSPPAAKAPAPVPATAPAPTLAPAALANSYAQNNHNDSEHDGRPVDQNGERQLLSGLVALLVPSALIASCLFAECAGCGQELSEGQALVALDR